MKEYNHSTYRKTPSRKKEKKKRWKVTIDSKEAAVNFFSILRAFQRAEGRGFIDQDVLRYIDKWISEIKKKDPDAEERSNDRRGPFRERDLTSINISFMLNHNEREVMLFMWKTIYSQLITPEGRENWVNNQGSADYELAMKNYRDWIASLESEGFIPEVPSKRR
jgi:hypothetical protein